MSGPVADVRHDVVSFGESMLRLSSAGSARLEEASALEVHVAGAESNVLAALARLGLRCAWLSALPDNPLGRRLARGLAGHGVDTGHVLWTDPGGRVGLYYTEENPEPLGTRVVYDRAGSAIARVDPDALDLSLLDRARWLHLTGITPALSAAARETWSRLLCRAGGRGVPVSLDVNYRAKLWDPRAAADGITEASARADVLICARADAAELWGLEGEPESVLRRMGERFGAEKTLVLTLGAEGAAELREGRYTRAPAYPSRGTVRFGSGDAFAAGYIYARLGGHHYTTAREELAASPLRFGNALAALKRCVAGDIAVVTSEEILSVLRGGGAERFR